MLENIKKRIRGDWRYKGVTNSLMRKHSWTNGSETVDLYHMQGAGNHAGYVVEVTGKHREARLQLANGFAKTLRHGLILADMYMRDDYMSPSAFMPSDRIESDLGQGDDVRQDDWLAAHGPDYEFGVIDPTELSRE